MIARTRTLIAESRAAQVAVIVMATLLVCSLGTWRSGFSQSEGHRAVPAWEMMATGDWLVPRMFGQLYLRKPPGMFWAIAAASKVLGQTEFAARSVSALACVSMALGAWWFARRWFEPRLAIFAGLAQATLPLTWEMGRAAEIEALHAACVQGCALAILHLGLSCRVGLRGGWRLWGTAMVGAIALYAALVVKGPAGAPVIAAAAGASIWMCGRAGRVRCATATFAAMLIGGLGFGFTLWMVSRAIPAGEKSITQLPGEFLWERARLLNIATLVPVGLASGLPATLALLAVPWRRQASPADTAAWSLGVACAGSLVLAMLAGVGNTRYVIPSLMLAAPLVAFALAGQLPFQTAARRASVALIAILLTGGVIAGELSERARNGTGDRGSGREVGVALADALIAAGVTGPIEIYADDLIEARPEVLLAAQRRAAARGLTLVPRWAPVKLRPFPAGSLVALRYQPDGDETVRLIAEGHLEAGKVAPERLFEGAVGRSRFYVAMIVR